MNIQPVHSKRPSAAPLSPALIGLGDDALENSSPLSVEDRKRVLNAVRLKLTLTIFVVAILMAMSAMIFFGVSRIFDWLTPSMQRDLEWKVQRGALELAQATQIAMYCVCPAAASPPASMGFTDTDGSLDTYSATDSISPWR